MHSPPRINVRHDAAADVLHADDSYWPVNHKLLVLSKASRAHFQEQVTSGPLSVRAHVGESANSGGPVIGFLSSLRAVQCSLSFRDKKLRVEVSDD
jgi:hypothetical protein